MVQSKSVESVLRLEESLWWKRFVKKVSFDPAVKERGSYEWWVDRVKRCSRSMNRHTERSDQLYITKTMLVVEQEWREMKSECLGVEQRWGYADVEVGWLWGLCKWVRGVCIRCVPLFYFLKTQYTVKQVAGLLQAMLIIVINSLSTKFSSTNTIILKLLKKLS